MYFIIFAPKISVTPEPRICAGTVRLSSPVLHRFNIGSYKLSGYFWIDGVAVSFKERNPPFKTRRERETARSPHNVQIVG